MKIAVVSDTHSLDVPKEVLKALKSVDLIVHAGDFCMKEDYEVFARLGDVKAVWGNMDEPYLRKRLPQTEIFMLGDFKIGLFHGEGAPCNILETVKNKFKGESLDAIIFGHSHQPHNERLDGVLLFNPGSPNDTIRAPYCSYGILEVKGSALIGTIIKIKGS